MPICFLFNIFPIMMNCSVMDTIIFGIPNSLFFTLMCNYVFGIDLWQVLYFYLICHYLKIKLKEVNREISQKCRNRRKIESKSIDTIIRSLNSIYNEINDYNLNLWSKYLMAIWLIFGVVIVFHLYILIFMTLSITSFLVLGYVVIVFITIFMIVINTSSSVNYEANKSYKLLNQLMVSFGSSRVPLFIKYRNIKYRIKV